MKNYNVEVENRDKKDTSVRNYLMKNIENVKHNVEAVNEVAENNVVKNFTVKVSHLNLNEVV